MTRRIPSSCFAILIAPLFLTPAVGNPDAAARQGANSIRNFRAASPSTAELRVTVDYTYAGANSGEITIHATPEERGGVFDPRLVDYDEIPVQQGTHTVTLTITRREGAADFLSVTVRVCISTIDRAILCQDFPHEKRWAAAAPPAPPPVAPPTPPPPSAPGTCSIGGEVTGPLQGVISPDSPASQPIKVTLRSMVLRAKDGGQPRRVSLTNRRYVFENVRAEATYEIFPDEGFRSNPPRRTVTCQANIRYRGRDFRITGPPVH